MKEQFRTHHVKVKGESMLAVEPVKVQFSTPPRPKKFVPEHHVALMLVPIHMAPIAARNILQFGRAG